MKHDCELKLKRQAGCASDLADSLSAETQSMAAKLLETRPRFVILPQLANFCLQIRNQNSII